MKKFFVVLMVLREVQNHKNNKFSFFTRKDNPYIEFLELLANQGKVGTILEHVVQKLH